MKVITRFFSIFAVSVAVLALLYGGDAYAQSGGIDSGQVDIKSPILQPSVINIENYPAVTTRAVYGGSTVSFGSLSGSLDLSYSDIVTQPVYANRLIFTFTDSAGTDLAGTVTVIGRSGTGENIFEEIDLFGGTVTATTKRPFSYIRRVYGNSTFNGNIEDGNDNIEIGITKFIGLPVRISESTDCHKILYRATTGAWTDVTNASSTTAWFTVTGMDSEQTYFRPHLVPNGSRDWRIYCNDLDRGN